MNVLIIGGTGFLSSGLVDFCLDAGHYVTTVTRGNRTEQIRSDITRIHADRNNKNAFREALVNRTFDLVIDAICFSADHAQQDLDVFSGRAGRLVMISTDFVYTVGRRKLPIPESTPRDTPVPYGIGKAQAEDVFFANTEKLATTVLRPPHIVGPGGLFGTGSLQGRDAALPARLRRHEPIILLDNGLLLIQPADRRDIAGAALAVTKTPETIGKVYNIVGPEAVTTRRYYEIIADALGVPLNVLSLPSHLYLQGYPDRVPFTLHRAYSTEALARDAGFYAQIPLEQSLHDMLIWLTENPPANSDARPSPTETKLHSLLAANDTDIINTLKEI